MGLDPEVGSVSLSEQGVLRGSGEVSFSVSPYGGVGWGITPGEGEEKGQGGRRLILLSESQALKLWHQESGKGQNYPWGPTLCQCWKGKENCFSTCSISDTKCVGFYSSH